MILSANGKDFEIPGKNLNVSLTQNFARSDVSGNTSGTDFVSAGNKAKEIAVSLVIQKTKADDLKRLIRTAEAIDDTSGEPLVYIISDELCLASNIRAVFFDGQMTIRGSSNLRAWDISFSLKEHKSPAEKREARAYSAEIVGKTSDGKVITAKPENSMLQNATAVAKETV